MPSRLLLWTFVPLLAAATARMSRSAGAFSLAGPSLIGTAVLVTAGVLSMGVGIVHLARRPGSRVGALLFLVGVAWFAGEWDHPIGNSAIVFSMGLVGYAAAPAVVAHLALAYPVGRLRSRSERVLVALGYMTTLGLLGLGPSLFFDPQTQGCAGCARNVWRVAERPDLFALLSRWGIRAGLGWSVLVGVTLFARLVRASPARRRVTGWVSAASLMLMIAAACAYGNGLRRGQLGTSDLDRELWRSQAAALVALAAAVGWGLLRARLTQRALSRLVVDLNAVATAPDGLRNSLGRMLGDPGLQLGYRVATDRWVDASGADVALPSAFGDAVATVDVAGDDVVLVHRRGLLDNPDVFAELQSAMRLGLENERLQAMALTQLADLRASRLRIVEAGDHERRRLERDLHDGAQQRLVGVLLALRLLRSQSADRATALEGAESELRRAIDDLRDLARGLYPTVLQDEGLAAALGALSETHPVRVTAAPAQRLPLSLETTAYLLVARAVLHGPCTVAVDVRDRDLVLDVDVQSVQPALGDLPDRISALGGELLSSGPAEGPAHLRLRLPREGTISQS